MRFRKRMIRFLKAVLLFGYLTIPFSVFGKGIDVLVTCNNLKGEIIATDLIRTNEENLIMYKDGGFGVTGYTVKAYTKEVGILNRRKVPCVVRELDTNRKILTCAIGSSAEILEQQLPQPNLS